MKLGDMKEAIKRGHSYRDHRAELLEMGFVFDRKKYMTGWPRLRGTLALTLSPTIDPNNAKHVPQPLT